MKFKIHFELADGTEDSFVVSGESIRKIRAKADAEIAKRGGKNAWSVDLEAA